MNKEDILKIAEECDLIVGNAEHGIYIVALTKFAKLVAEHEREACAKKLCEKQREGKSWVGLTDKDLQGICDEWQIYNGAWMDFFVMDITAKLKERNT
jgi:hypothetical protein